MSNSTFFASVETKGILLLYVVCMLVLLLLPNSLSMENNQGRLCSVVVAAGQIDHTSRYGYTTTQ
jgi:hypothetical protein